MSGNWWGDYFQTVYVPAAEQFCAVLIERLLRQFSSVDREAEAVAEKEYERLGRLPGDENVGMASLAERAKDVGITWYQNMKGTRQSLINLYAVGLRAFSEGEPRWILIGMSAKARLVTVVYTVRDEERIRLISARKATRKEAKFYA